MLAACINLPYKNKDRRKYTLSTACLNVKEMKNSKKRLQKDKSSTVDINIEQSKKKS